MTVGDSSESRAGAASSLKELLCNGEAPWATGAPLTAIQGIGPLAKRMGVVALDIQAANEEKKLVRFEMASLLSSYNQDVLVLQQAVDAASQEISQQLDQQELLIEQLDSSTLSVEQQRDLNCSLASAHNAVSFQLGKRMLLSGRLAGLQRLQAAAEALFVQVTQRANASDDIPLTEDAILAAADEILQHDAEGAADSDDPYGSPDDGDPDPDEFLTAVESESAAAEATAVAGTAADPTRSAELPADMQAAELLAQAVPAPDNAPLAETVNPRSRVLLLLRFSGLCLTVFLQPGSDPTLWPPKLVLLMPLCRQVLWQHGSETVVIICRDCSFGRPPLT